jgi:hypothetical protein
VEQAAAQGDRGVNWSAEQLRILRAMGHEPMRLAPAGSPVGAAVSRDSTPRVEEQSRLAAAPAGSGTGALAAAIVRAAAGRDVSALALDLDQLRREPGLKRALWPRLRALRREHG